MSLPLVAHARLAVRSATIAASLLLVAAAPAAAAESPFAPAVPPADAVAPQLPWTSVSDVLAATLADQKLAGGAATPASAPAPAPAAPAPAPAPAPAYRVFAAVDGLELREPSRDVHGYGFHEGSTQGRSLHPVGRLVSNESAMTAPTDVEGPDYRIMASRGRGVGASTAVDIAMDADVPVHAMLEGTVVSLNTYDLYGRTTDVLIEIVPKDRPNMKVQIFHVREPKVAIGDVVTPETVLALPRQLPFGSQIDRLVGRAGPHVHVQVVGG